METYCGPEAFSEVNKVAKDSKLVLHQLFECLFLTFFLKKVEMRNIRDFVQTLDPVPVLGHCFHSYSQLWLWPYGYAYNAYPENR